MIRFRETTPIDEVPATIAISVPCTVQLLLVLIGIGHLTALSYLFLVDVEPHQQSGMGLFAVWSSAEP